MSVLEMGDCVLLGAIVCLGLVTTVWSVLHKLFG